MEVERDSDFGFAWEPFFREFPLLFRGGDDIIDLGAGAGWHALLWTLCAELERIATRQREAGEAPLEIRQVKQKIGTLRVYVRNGTPAASDLIHAAELTSAGLCEFCGDAGTLRCLGGWYTTICERHFQEARATWAADDPRDDGAAPPSPDPLWGEGE